MSNQIDQYNEIIAELVANCHGTKASEQIIATYFKHLSEIPIDLLRATVDTYLSQAEDTFLPAIGKLKKIALSLGTRPIPSANEAWAEVCQYLPKVLNGDAIRKPKLSNEVAQKVADALGWRRLYFDKGFLEHRFISEYNAAIDRQQAYAMLPADVRALKETLQLQNLSKSIDHEYKLLENAEGEDWQQ